MARPDGTCRLQIGSSGPRSVSTYKGRITVHGSQSARKYVKSGPSGAPRASVSPKKTLKLARLSPPLDRVLQEFQSITAPMARYGRSDLERKRHMSCDSIRPGERLTAYTVNRLPGPGGPGLHIYPFPKRLTCVLRMTLLC